MGEKFQILVKETFGRCENKNCMVAIHASVNFSLSPWLGIWEMLLGPELRGRGMVYKGWDALVSYASKVRCVLVIVMYVYLQVCVCVLLALPMFVGVWSMTGLLWQLIEYYYYYSHSLIRIFPDTHIPCYTYSLMRIFPDTHIL